MKVDRLPGTYQHVEIRGQLSLCLTKICREHRYLSKLEGGGGVNLNLITNLIYFRSRKGCAPKTVNTGVLTSKFRKEGKARMGPGFPTRRNTLDNQSIKMIVGTTNHVKGDHAQPPEGAPGQQQMDQQEQVDSAG